MYKQLTSGTFSQPDLVDTIQDALACISQPQFVQGGPSGLGEASHQVLIEALPPILVLHLKRFRYDAAAGGVIKIEKPIQFAPELEIPLGTIFTFFAAAEANGTP
jgi:ubiquitin carboxyl-terminal hydrolase 10